MFMTSFMECLANKSEFAAILQRERKSVAGPRSTFGGGREVGDKFLLLLLFRFSLSHLISLLATSFNAAFSLTFDSSNSFSLFSHTQGSSVMAIWGMIRKLKWLFCECACCCCSCRLPSSHGITQSKIIRGKSYWRWWQSEHKKWKLNFQHFFSVTAQFFGLILDLISNLLENTIYFYLFAEREKNLIAQPEAARGVVHRKKNFIY